jgi:arylsulfatase A-like enzyme
MIFLTSLLLITLFTTLHALDKPNIILCMTDDQGWGDVGYNGLKKIKTPNLDAMAAEGLRFNRFYAAHPSCSPTRASVLTGRHPYRGKVDWPGMPLQLQEKTIAEVVKLAGYRTAHFGKWHLSGGQPGAGRALPVSDPLHPGHSGFDEWFTVSNWFDTDWTFSSKGEPVKTKGDGSDAIMVEAMKFIEAQATGKTPFLAVIWFGSPHVPLSPTAEDLAAAGGSAYYGEMIGVDRSMGALRAKLRRLGIEKNTLLAYNSDNGAWMDGSPETDKYGSNKNLRGHKGELWEGGIRVPGIIEWPARIKQPAISDIPVVTSDFYPTIIEILGLTVPQQPQPIDGISLLPLFDGKMKERPKPFGFWHHGNAGSSDTFNHGYLAWQNNQYKLHMRGPEPKIELYDLIADISETKNLAADKPEVVKKMTAELEAWKQSVRDSRKGLDYLEK